MLWAALFFLIIMVSGTVVAVTWIEKDKPKLPPPPAPQPHIDGYALCPGCGHPLVASHTIQCMRSHP